MSVVPPDSFEFYLNLAKPLVLNLADANDRIIAAAWVQKLKDTNVGPEQLRTDYLKLLLFVLQRARIIGPFKENPNNYDKLEEFPENYKLHDVAKELLEAEEVERRQRILRGLAGPSGDYPPFTIEYSSNLLEYTAAQDIPNFGVHAFYALSKEPLSKWDNLTTAVFPKGVHLPDESVVDLSVHTDKDFDEVNLLDTTAKSRSRSHGRSKSTLGITVTDESGAPDVSGDSSRYSGKIPVQIETIQPEHERVTPTWGSNLGNIIEGTAQDECPCIDLVTLDDEEDSFLAAERALGLHYEQKAPVTVPLMPSASAEVQRIVEEANRQFAELPIPTKTAKSSDVKFQRAGKLPAPVRPEMATARVTTIPEHRRQAQVRVPEVMSPPISIRPLDIDAEYSRLYPNRDPNAPRTPPFLSRHPQIRGTAEGKKVYKPHELPDVSDVTWHSAVEFIRDAPLSPDSPDPRLRERLASQKLRTAFPNITEADLRQEFSLAAEELDFPELLDTSFDQAEEATKKQETVQDELKSIDQEQESLPALFGVPVTTPRQSPLPRRGLLEFDESPPFVTSPLALSPSEQYTLGLPEVITYEQQSRMSPTLYETALSQAILETSYLDLPGDRAALSKIKAALSPGRAAALSPARAASLSPARAAAMSPGRVAALSPGRAASLSPGRAAALSPGRAAALSPGRTAALSPGRAAALSPGRAAALSPGRAAYVSPGRATAFSPGRVAVQSPGTAARRSPCGTGARETTPIKTIMSPKAGPSHAITPSLSPATAEWSPDIPPVPLVQSTPLDPINVPYTMPATEFAFPSQMLLFENPPTEMLPPVRTSPPTPPSPVAYEEFATPEQEDLAGLSGTSPPLRSLLEAHEITQEFRDSTRPKMRKFVRSKSKNVPVSRIVASATIPPSISEAPTITPYIQRKTPPSQSRPLTETEEYFIGEFSDPQQQQLVRQAMQIIADVETDEPLPYLRAELPPAPPLDIPVPEDAVQLTAVSPPHYHEFADEAAERQAADLGVTSPCGVDICDAYAAIATLDEDIDEFEALEAAIRVEEERNRIVTPPSVPRSTRTYTPPIPYVPTRGEFIAGEASQVSYDISTRKFPVERQKPRTPPSVPRRVTSPRTPKLPWVPTFEETIRPSALQIAVEAGAEGGLTGMQAPEGVRHIEISPRVLQYSPDSPPSVPRRYYFPETPPIPWVSNYDEAGAQTPEEIAHSKISPRVLQYSPDTPPSVPRQYYFPETPPIPWVPTYEEAPRTQYRVLTPTSPVTPLEQLSPSSRWMRELTAQFGNIFEGELLPDDLMDVHYPIDYQPPAGLLDLDIQESLPSPLRPEPVLRDWTTPEHLKPQYPETYSRPMAPPFEGARVSQPTLGWSPSARRTPTQRAWPPFQRIASPPELFISPTQRISPAPQRISPPPRRISPALQRVSPRTQRTPPSRERIPSPPQRMSPRSQRISPLPQRISPLPQTISPSRVSPSPRVSRQAPCAASPKQDRELHISMIDEDLDEFERLEREFDVNIQKTSPSTRGVCPAAAATYVEETVSRQQMEAYASATERARDQYNQLISPLPQRIMPSRVSPPSPRVSPARRVMRSPEYDEDIDEFERLEREFDIIIPKTSPSARGVCPAAAAVSAIDRAREQYDQLLATGATPPKIWERLEGGIVREDMPPELMEEPPTGTTPPAAWVSAVDYSLATETSPLIASPQRQSQSPLTPSRLRAQLLSDPNQVPDIFGILPAERYFMPFLPEAATAPGSSRRVSPQRQKLLDLDIDQLGSPDMLIPPELISPTHRNITNMSVNELEEMLSYIQLSPQQDLRPSEAYSPIVYKSPVMSPKLPYTSPTVGHIMEEQQPMLQSPTSPRTMVPVRSRSPSPLSVRSRSPSPLPARSRSPSPLPVRSRSPSPLPVKSRSPSPFAPSVFEETEVVEELSALEASHFISPRTPPRRTPPAAPLISPYVSPRSASPPNMLLDIEESPSRTSPQYYKKRRLVRKSTSTELQAQQEPRVARSPPTVQLGNLVQLTPEDRAAMQAMSAYRAADDQYAALLEKTPSPLAAQIVVGMPDDDLYEDMHLMDRPISYRDRSELPYALTDERIGQIVSPPPISPCVQADVLYSPLPTTAIGEESPPRNIMEEYEEELITSPASRLFESVQHEESGFDDVEEADVLLQSPPRNVYIPETLPSPYLSHTPPPLYDFHSDFFATPPQKYDYGPDFTPSPVMGYTPPPRAFNYGPGLTPSPFMGYTPPPRVIDYGAHDPSPLLSHTPSTSPLERRRFRETVSGHAIHYGAPKPRVTQPPSLIPLHEVAHEPEYEPYRPPPSPSFAPIYRPLGYESPRILEETEEVYISPGGPDLDESFVRRLTRRYTEEEMKEFKFIDD